MRPISGQVTTGEKYQNSIIDAGADNSVKRYPWI
jgi:hypothetical protein